MHAICEAAAGRRYLSPPLSDNAVKAYARKAREALVDMYETLTTREREVLQLAAEGHTNPQIADRLFISPRTVEVHRANLMRKLGLRNYADLVRYAMEQALIPSKEDPLKDREDKK